MQELRITIDNAQHAALLKSWLKHIDFIRKIEDEPMRWELQGRPASDEEILQMLKDSADPEGEIRADNFFMNLFKQA